MSSQSRIILFVVGSVAAVLASNAPAHALTWTLNKFSDNDGTYADCCNFNYSYTL